MTFAVKILGMKPNITGLHAALVLKSSVKPVDNIPISIEAAKTMLVSISKGPLVVEVVNEAMIENLGKAFTIDTGHEEVVEVVEEKQEKRKPMTANLEMKVSTPAVAGPSIDTSNLNLGANILEQVLNAAMKDQVTKVITDLLPQIKSIINHEITNNFVKRIEIKVNDAEYKNVGAQHKSFPELLRLCAIKLPDGTPPNIWMVGPAGTGKTTACSAVAKALGLEFGAIGTSDNKYELSGFADANGKIVNTMFRERFIKGGLMLLDEIDSWYPNALLALQAALGNGFCAFPDGVFQRHPDCIVLCAANTFGQGEVTEYVGRMKQDAAFLDRFIFFKWDIDEQLERHIAGNKEWVARVQAIRRRVNEKQIKVLITPRASIYGSAMLAAGVPWQQVEEMTLRKSMTNEQWKSIQ